MHPPSRSPEPTGQGHQQARQARTTFNEGTGRLAATLLSPTLIVLVLVVVYPILSALRESLYTAASGVDAGRLRHRGLAVRRAGQLHRDLQR